MKYKRIIVGMICFMFMVSGCQSKQVKEITLTFKDMKTVEYGSTFDSKELVESCSGTIDTYPVVDTKIIGKQKISFEVKDGDNKKSFEYEIEVVDTQKPIIELSKDKIEIDFKAKLDPNTYVKSVKDPVDGDISYKKESDVKEGDAAYYTYHNSVNVEKAGNYEVNYKAVDKNGNESQQILKVTVNSEKKVTSTQTPQTTKPTETKPTVPDVEEKPNEPMQSDYDYVLPSTVAKMKAAANVNKIVIVTSTNSTTRSGTAQYFVKSGSTWNEKLKVKCQLGKAGMGTGSEYSTKTPVGTYRFTHAYGIKSNPGSRMAYTQINSHHYWCGDQYYNQFVDDTVKDHSGCSIDNDEHLIDYPISYDYFASFSYNSSNIKGKGAAFFLHCINSRYSYTGGCVAVPTSDMIYLLKNIDTSTAFVIAQISNISKY